MELLVASATGILTATGIYLMLRARTFPVILGLTFLSYAVNVFLFSMGRLVINRPPIVSPIPTLACNASMFARPGCRWVSSS